MGGFELLLDMCGCLSIPGHELSDLVVESDILQVVWSISFVELGHLVLWSQISGNTFLLND